MNGYVKIERQTSPFKIPVCTKKSVKVLVLKFSKNDSTFNLSTVSGKGYIQLEFIGQNLIG
jgi:hypothetical protein